jgi:hypothetical protein
MLEICAERFCRFAAPRALWLADLFQVMTLNGLASDRNDPAHDAANATGEKIERLCK